MKQKVFLQRKYEGGCIITTEFFDDSKFTCPKFISQYRFITFTVDENGQIIHDGSDESVPWIDNPNAT